MSNTIKKYIRENGKPTGLLLAYKDEDDGIVKIGFSKCNTKYDTFDKDLANRIALNRTKNGTRKRWTDIPGVRDEFQSFLERCNRYFKKSSVFSL